MPSPQKVSIEQIVDAYRSTGSVWKSAKMLGVCGQSVHERLKAIDYPMHNQPWTEEEYAELRLLVDQIPINQIAQRLGRPYYGVAMKVSRLGLAKRAGNRMNRKIPRGAGLNKESVAKLIRDLKNHKGALTAFCRMNGLLIETFVQAIQKYDLEFWKQYSREHTGLDAVNCEYCGAEFHPMTKKQRFCTRWCTTTKRRDEEYFGGKRATTIGLAEGICQLCLQPKERLSSHHIFGKQNDPNNECLIAVCSGCHQLIGILAGRKFVDTDEGWQNLIHLVMARRMADKPTDAVGVHAYVEIERVTAEQLEEMQDSWFAEEYHATGPEHVVISMEEV